VPISEFRSPPCQGDPADAVYIQKGKVELRVLSQPGKEAILAILGADDFFGEGCPVPAVLEMMMRIDDRQLRFEDPLLLLFCERPRCETRRGPPAPTWCWEPRATGSLPPFLRRPRPIKASWMSCPDKQQAALRLLGLTVHAERVHQGTPGC
jgi:hypothetical protein